MQEIIPYGSLFFLQGEFTHTFVQNCVNASQTTLGMDYLTESGRYPETKGF